MAIEGSIVEDPRLMYSIGRNRYTTVRKFGYNSAVAGTAEVVWSNGNGYTGWITSAAKASVTSASANDTASTGTHARKIRVYGLNASWELYDEEISLTGATPSLTTETFIRVFRLKITEVGTYGNSNDGKITVTAGGLVVATIPAGTGQSQMAVYATPANHTAYIAHVRASSESAKPVEFRLKVREKADVTSGAMGATRTINTLVGIELPIEVDPHSMDMVPEKSDLWLEATGTASSAFVTGEFDLILVRDY